MVPGHDSRPALLQHVSIRKLLNLFLNFRLRPEINDKENPEWMGWVLFFRWNFPNCESPKDHEPGGRRRFLFSKELCKCNSAEWKLDITK